MTDVKHLAELSGFSQDENNLPDMEDIIKVIDRITETNFPSLSQRAVNSSMLREDKPSDSAQSDDIIKLSKTKLEIPKMM